MLTFRWLVGCSPPFTRSGTMNTTFAPGKASSLSGFIPMGWCRLSRYASSSLSSGMQGGSATVVPGMNTSVVSGSSALIRPWPYSKSSFIGVSSLSLAGPYSPRYFWMISRYSSG